MRHNNMRLLARNRQNGFTLIEVIITIVVVSILATMIYSYFGSAITQSAAPLIRMGSAVQLQNVMENITANYYNNNIAGAYNLSIFTNNADPSYIGAEGATLNNSYGQYTLIDNHYIKFVSNTETPIVAGDPQNLLKVTIKDSFGNTLTALFNQ